MQQEEEISIDVQELLQEIQFLIDPNKDQEKDNFPERENKSLQFVQRVIENDKIPYYNQSEKLYLGQKIVEFVEKFIPYNYLSQRAGDHCILGASKVYHIYVILQGQYPDILEDGGEQQNDKKIKSKKNVKSKKQQKKQQKQEEDQQEGDNEQLEKLVKDIQEVRDKLMQIFEFYFNFFLDYWFHTPKQQQGLYYNRIKQSVLEIIEELQEQRHQKYLGFSDKERFLVFENVVEILVAGIEIEECKELCKIGVYMYYISEADRGLFNEKMVQILMQKYKQTGKKQVMIKTHEGAKIHPIIYVILKGHQEHFQLKNLFASDGKLKSSNMHKFEVIQSDLEELIKYLLKRCMTADKSTKLKDFVKLFIEQICDLILSKEFLFAGGY